MGQLETVLVVALTLIVSLSLVMSSFPPVRVDMIPLSNGNRNGKKLIGTRYITIHNTGNYDRGADALRHAKLLKNPTTDRSWHFTVDDHRIVKHLPESEQGYHAGLKRHPNQKGNLQSIGIEICVNRDGNFEKAVRNAQKLVKLLMQAYNIPLSRVVTHKHWVGKQCPAKLLNRWDGFKAGVKNLPWQHGNTGYYGR